MISKNTNEGEDSSERKQGSNDCLKMVRNNICENSLQLQEKGMERKLHNRLHVLSSQASQLRQKIKVLNMEKQKADLEIKKRYFPGHDFQQDETQLQTSMRRLILHCNQFYLTKKQRYPIRACVKDDKINSARSSLYRNSESKKHIPIEVCNSERSKSECSDRYTKNRNMNSAVVSKVKEEKRINSGSNRSRTLPEILLPAEKDVKPMRPLNTKHAQNLARFSVLLGAGKNSQEDSPAKFPGITKNERKTHWSPTEGSRLEVPDEDFDTSLPNINLKEILSDTNVKTFTEPKPKITPGHCSSQQSSRRGHRFDRSHIQNLLELESTRTKWKMNKYFQLDIKNDDSSKSSETPGYSNSSPTLSEESFRRYREREAMNTVPRDVNQIKQDHNWRLTTPVKRSEDFIDNLTVVMMAGMQGLSCHNISLIPLNSARRALRHTPTFKMQQFLKQMIAQGSQAQQFEVSKLQAEFEATLAAELETKPSNQSIAQTDPKQVQVERDIPKGCESEVIDGDISEDLEPENLSQIPEDSESEVTETDLEPEVFERSVQNIKRTEFG